jgi:hypothetical protein
LKSAFRRLTRLIRRLLGFHEFLLAVFRYDRRASNWASLPKIFISFEHSLTEFLESTHELQSFLNEAFSFEWISIELLRISLILALIILIQTRCEWTLQNKCLTSSSCDILDVARLNHLGTSTLTECLCNQIKQWLVWTSINRVFQTSAFLISSLLTKYLNSNHVFEQ